MTRFGATLDDVGGRVPWRALGSFVGHLDASSALMSELAPEVAGWQGTQRLPAILADIYDLLATLNRNFAVANTPKGKRKPPRPKPYPRPGAKGDREARRIGSAAIPVKDFDAWWEGDG